jgi:cellulose synthase/poly-beta-1,6-N-acetylglucosamine synthase-like glycosyltransferase
VKPPRSETASRLVTRAQLALGVLVTGACTAELFGSWITLLRIAVPAIIAFYVMFVGLKVLLTAVGSRATIPSRRQVTQNLPTYSVLAPLRGEADVVRRLVQELSQLRYPADKLDILLLVEEYDAETRQAITEISLPQQFRMVIVPDVGPRTKPKACNCGYMQSRGGLVVIYDAEDRPEPSQLLKAAGAFESIRTRHGNVGCLQARLAFWNPRASWVSAFYWAEYVVHYQWILVGLSKLGLIPPLGGTSNHFLRIALDRVAEENGKLEFLASDGEQVTIWGPWDPWNVTEDADLAFRLAEAGFSVKMFDSVTYEEAPSSLKVAKNQRGRWLHGYMQTALVHMRQPIRKIRRVGLLRYLAFLLFIGGTPLSLMLNPITWAATALYIATRMGNLPGIAVFIEGLFPAPVYYVGMVLFLGGNFFLYYQKMLTVIRQQQAAEAQVSAAEHRLQTHLHKQLYGLTIRISFTPVWWAFTSVSVFRGLRRLLIPSQRSAWDKTVHSVAVEEQLDTINYR